MITPTSGTYMLHGMDVSHVSDNEQSDVRNREIGFIFQGFNLIQSLTAQENVELPLIYRGVPKKERTKLAITTLERVGLGINNPITEKTDRMSQTITELQNTLLDINQNGIADSMETAWHFRQNRPPCVTLLWSF